MIRSIVTAPVLALLVFAAPLRAADVSANAYGHPFQSL
jgi:hypothetical protein